MKRTCDRFQQLNCEDFIYSELKELFPVLILQIFHLLLNNQTELRPWLKVNPAIISAALSAGWT